MTDIAGRKVLIVEDEALIALDLKQAVEEAGGSVIGPFLRMDRALSAVKNALIDAAILDVDIAGVPVFAVADRLTWARVPIVFHTARHDALGLAQRFRGARVATKPSSSDRIVAMVAQALPRPAALAPS